MDSWFIGLGRIGLLVSMHRSLLCLALLGAMVLPGRANELERRFDSPPAEARPWVYWFWMGSTLTADGITGDLQALKENGFGGAVMCSMADVCTPWAGYISNSPTPEIIAYSEPWWKLVRHAAAEAGRMGLQFGVGNCAGYETCGGAWVTPEHSMQEVVWSKTDCSGPGVFSGLVPKPQPDLHGHQPFPVYLGHTGKIGRPEVPARRTYFRDIAVLAVPAQGVITAEQIINLSDRLRPDGTLNWTIPAGAWTIYRFGHTTMGSMLQPCQWEALGLQADMMSPEAMADDLDHVIGDIQKHAGDLIGRGMDFVWFDSYEAGTPTWTPRMRAEFQARRGYDLTTYLPVLANRVVGSADDTHRFRADFQQTVGDLYREVYFRVIRDKLHAAGLRFCSEPYWGPWQIPAVVTNVDELTAEFWVKNRHYNPSAVSAVVAAARQYGINQINSEAFTSSPDDSQWDETPAELKPIGDAAFCDGVNRFVLHRFTHQPYGERYEPGWAMGQWGTHFDRTQTWWKPFRATVQYWQRCDALLQWGRIATNDFAAVAEEGGVKLKSIHRQEGGQDVYFVANLGAAPGTARCAFGVSDRQPEWWNPNTGERRALPDFESAEGRTVVPLTFAPNESCFVVFQKKIQRDDSRSSRSSGGNFAPQHWLSELQGAWTVQFDPKWGGPTEPVSFPTLTDWTNRPESGIRYYSGTAEYEQEFDCPAGWVSGSHLWLDLGTVHDLASVSLNGQDLGVVWTAPWQVDLTPALRARHNRLVIKVTNCWANRLIGDEQQPADCAFRKGDRGFGGPLNAFPDWLIKGQPRPSGRYTFTTWNYFNRNSPLESSGLLGPVRLMEQ